MHKLFSTVIIEYKTKILNEKFPYKTKKKVQNKNKMRYSNKWNTEYDAEKYNNTVEVSCGETIQQNGRAGVPSMSHALPSSTHFNFQFWFNINWDWTLPSSAHFNVHFWSIINWKWTLPSSVHLNILIQYQLKMVNAVLCWFQFSILIQYQ